MQNIEIQTTIQNIHNFILLENQKNQIRSKEFDSLFAGLNFLAFQTKNKNLLQKIQQEKNFVSFAKNLRLLKKVKNNQFIKE